MSLHYFPSVTLWCIYYYNSVLKAKKLRFSKVDYLSKLTQPGTRGDELQTQIHLILQARLLPLMLCTFWPFVLDILIQRIQFIINLIPALCYQSWYGRFTVIFFIKSNKKSVPHIVPKKVSLKYPLQLACDVCVWATASCDLACLLT